MWVCLCQHSTGLPLEMRGSCVSLLICTINLTHTYTHTHPDTCVCPLPAPVLGDSGTDRRPAGASSRGCSLRCWHGSLQPLCEAAREENSWIRAAEPFSQLCADRCVLYLYSGVHPHPVCGPSRTHRSWSLWCSRTPPHSPHSPDHTRLHLNTGGHAAWLVR